MSPGEVSGGMDAVSGGASDVGGGGGVDSVDAGYFADVGNFDPAGVAGLSDIPGQSIEGALGQMLFDLALQQDTTTAAGMKDARGTLDSLANLGFGRVEGLNPNNPTQSVEEMLAAQNVSNVLGYVAPALASLVPGYGTVSALGKGIANIHGLMTNRLTPAEVMPGLAAGIISAKTNIPSGILEGLFEGNLGKAAGAGAQAGLTSLANSMSPFGGLVAALSGIGPSFGKAVSDAVSGATGGRSGGISSLPGAGPAPSTSTAPMGSAYGDSGITQEISPTRAAIEQAARETMTPAWDRQVVAGRYGPTLQYEYGA